MPGTRVYTAVIFRFFSAFAIFRLLAARNAYTSTALIFRVFRIFLFSGYLPAATHISPPATARFDSHIVNQLLLAIITAAKLILVLWLRRYSKSCQVPRKLIFCIASLGISWALVGSGVRNWVDGLMRRGILFSRGACARTERQARRRGRRAEVQCAALAPQTRALVAYTSRQGHQIFFQNDRFF